MVSNPTNWGLPLGALETLEASLRALHERYAHFYRSKTRDSGHCGFRYVVALLRMETERNFTSIDRLIEKDGQQMQHFMSNSPWSARDLLGQVRFEVGARPEFSEGGWLLLDESCDEKASDCTIGAGRQYNGRLGKIEMSQTGVFLAFSTGREWLWVDGELFLPQAWFEKSQQKLRERLGLPKERVFASKLELGEQMIERVVSEGKLKIKGVACDTLYGRSVRLRRQLGEKGLVYMAEVPVDTRVYLTEPEVTWKGGKKPKQVISGASGMEVRSLGNEVLGEWERIRVRATERGYLEDEFRAVRVWTVGSEESAGQAEWLIGRREESGRVSYGLSNAAAESSLAELAKMKCERHFIECSNQEAKSELGWDELRAQKYTAWEHHLGLVILAHWYIVETRLEWERKYPINEQLSEELGVAREEFPRLSVRNVRELLRATLPLPEVTREKARDLVSKHLLNRVRVRKSRIKKKSYVGTPL